MKRNQTIIDPTGSDFYFGGGGEDFISTADGGADSANSDRLRGGKGSDTLIGSSGNDFLSGGNRGDTLYGAAGDDTLKGGNDADLFLFGAGDGHDVIANTGFLRIGLDIAGIDSFDDLILTVISHGRVLITFGDAAPDQSISVPEFLQFITAANFDFDAVLPI